MSETEQSETLQRAIEEWAELQSELAEVRAKNSDLQVQLGQWQVGYDVIKESRDKAVAEVELLRAEYLQAKEMANANSDNAASLREQLQKITAQRDAGVQADGSKNRIIHALQGAMTQLRADHDVAKKDLAHSKEAADMFEAENAALRDTVRTLRDEQMHTDIPGILLAIHRLAEQARELI